MEQCTNTIQRDLKSSHPHSSKSNSCICPLGCGIIKKNLAKKVGEMKEGSLVTLSVVDYPQYKGMTGLLVKRAPLKKTWAVMIAGKLHPFGIREQSMLRMSNESV